MADAVVPIRQGSVKTSGPSAAMRSHTSSSAETGSTTRPSSHTVSGDRTVAVDHHFVNPAREPVVEQRLDMLGGVETARLASQVGDVAHVHAQRIRCERFGDAGTRKFGITLV